MARCVCSDRRSIRHQEGVAQALRGRAASIQPGRQQLLRVERVAFAAHVQTLEQLRVGRRSEDVGERFAELVAIERLEVDPARPLEPIELGQQRAQRVSAVELVRAVGQQQHHPLLAHAPRQKRYKRAGRAVGPVHVLEDQHHRGRVGQQIKQLEHRLEQPHLPGGVWAVVAWTPVVEARKDRRQLVATSGAQCVEYWVVLADQRSQRAQQRRVGQLAVGLLNALAAQDQGRRFVAVGQPLLELADQPRLPDSGVTAEQDEAGPPGAGLLDGERQLGQLSDPSHEVRARQPRPHG